MENFESTQSDFFNLSAEGFVNKKSERVNDLYKPDASDGKEGVYKALVRFLPWHENPKQLSKIKKYGYWLKNPVNGEEFAVDCPSSIGKPSLMQDTFFKLYNSKNASEKELTKCFKRNENYWSLVQIVQDPQHPELVGKIMVFKFGFKLNQMIEAEMEPEFGTPHIPYDLFHAKNFYLHITKQGGYNNYDLCKFTGEFGPVVIDGIPVTKDQAGLDRALNYIKTQAPNLLRFQYKEESWTNEIQEKVVSVIKNTIHNPALVEQIYKANNVDANVIAKVNEAKSVAATEILSTPTMPSTGFDFEASIPKVSAPTIAQTQPVFPPMETSGPGNVNDDLLAGL